MPSALRNVFLIVRREYLQRIRTKAFIITTLLTPAIMGGFTLLPSIFMSMKMGGEKDLVVVTDDAQLGQNFQQHFAKSASDDGTKYNIAVRNDTSGAAIAQLDSDVTSKKLDGFLVLTRATMQSGKVQYHARSTGDFVSLNTVADAVKFAAIQQRLAASGIRNLDVESLLKDVDVQAITVGKGNADAGVEFLTAFLLVMVLYMTVMIHGIAVMRSVLEEKTSRVMEVMLASVTPKELMAGKIIGVGAVGLTQIFIWAALGLVFSGPALVAAHMSKSDLHFTFSMGIYFMLFYLLGFLLYSSMSAALGAMVSSEEEAQQLQFIVMMPIIMALMCITFVIRAPSSTVSVLLSMVPFFAPILMYLRIVVETPPLWQIALCLGLMVVTIYVALSVCARIYRVGILMYGKRPTLPEILKWIRYA